MGWLRALGTGGIAAGLIFAAAAAYGVTGIAALSAETLYSALPNPLVVFGDGRTISLLSHMGALASHGADDDDVVLLFLESSAVENADDELVALLLYDEANVGCDVAKLVAGPGSVLLFETAAGATDPRSAMKAQFAEPSGQTRTLYLHRGVPEPSWLGGLAAGAATLALLARRRLARRN